MSLSKFVVGSLGAASFGEGVRMLAWGGLTAVENMEQRGRDAIAQRAKQIHPLNEAAPGAALAKGWEFPPSPSTRNRRRSLFGFLKGTVQPVPTKCGKMMRHDHAARAAVDGLDWGDYVHVENSESGRRYVRLVKSVPVSGSDLDEGEVFGLFTLHFRFTSDPIPTNPIPKDGEVELVHEKTMVEVTFESVNADFKAEKFFKADGYNFEGDSGSIPPLTPDFYWPFDTEHIFDPILDRSSNPTSYMQEWQKASGKEGPVTRASLYFTDQNFPLFRNCLDCA